MRRRTLVLSTAAVAATGAGFGWAWWRQSSRPPTSDGEPDPAHGVDVWSLRFESPSGGEIALAAMRGRPLILNFWATWCPPCIVEMPLLDRFQRTHKAAGWQVLGLAVDSAAPVREFLARQTIGFAIGLAGMQGVALSRSLGNTRGALPFSVGYDASGAAVERKLGTLNWDELAGWASRMR
jgi:thiol-disulfide isomerase/thioredoxin